MHTYRLVEKMLHKEIWRKHKYVVTLLFNYDSFYIRKKVIIFSSKEYWTYCILLREAFRKNWISYDIESKGGQVANSKHDFFPKRNYDKRVGARIINQIMKAMNNSLFIEKQFSKPTVITFTFIFLHKSSKHYYFVVYIFKEF